MVSVNSFAPMPLPLVSASMADRDFSLINNTSNNYTKIDSIIIIILTFISCLKLLFTALQFSEQVCLVTVVTGQFITFSLYGIIRSIDNVTMDMKRGNCCILKHCAIFAVHNDTYCMKQSYVAIYRDRRVE